MSVQKISKAVVFALTVVGFMSCSDDAEEPFSVIGDVYVSKKMMGDDVVYAKSYYAYGNGPMDVATVTGVEGEINLLEIDDNPRIFGVDEAFSTEIPSEGNYLFTVLNESVPHETTDLLVFEDINLPYITSTIVADEVLELAWEAGENGALHTVRLLNTAGEIIFMSPFLASEVETFEIDPASGAENWADGYPNLGDTYSLELHRVLFEEDASNANYLYNIQEIAISEVDVIWE